MDKISFLERILGTTDISYFIATLFFAMVGVFISLLRHSTNRDKSEAIVKGDPVKFSLSFLISDNWKRVAFNVLLILVTIRFCEQVTGLQLNEFVALLIGVFYDQLGEILQQKKVLIGKKSI